MVWRLGEGGGVFSSVVTGGGGVFGRLVTGGRGIVGYNDMRGDFPTFSDIYPGSGGSVVNCRIQIRTGRSVCHPACKMRNDN